MLAIVTGMIGSYPVAGITAHYLQYLLGFRKLGWDVLYLEDTGRWPYNPTLQTFTADDDSNVAYLAGVMGQFGLGDRWSYRGVDNRNRGISSEDVGVAIRRADIFLNVSGACWLRPEYRGARRTVYLDTDPGYNQIKAVSGRDESADNVNYSVGIGEHDYHLTFAENIGRADCTLPVSQFNWQPTRQPVVLDLWWPTAPRHDRPFTTIMSWTPYSTPIEFHGRRFFGKEASFRNIISLPLCIGAALELAIAGTAPEHELRANGWHIVDARLVSSDFEVYRRYIQASAAEFSVAKDIYVAMRTGWFSERSASYLACGRPVLVQDTGFENIFPTGMGLCTFSDLETAVEGVQRIQSDYQMHCAASRKIAEEYFNSSKVLTKLLTDIGL